MIEAELKGKLPEVENSEDVLTSNVFNLLKYVSKDILLEILSHAKTLSGKRFLNCVNLNLKDYIPKFIFWEHIKDYGEPDLLIKFSDKDGHELILCMEVKYYSSKSGEGDNDQLRRYFEGLTIASSKVKSQFLGVIYLTKYPSREELEDSVRYIKQKGVKDAENKLFQLRWFEITNAIECYNQELLNEHEKLIMKDLLIYLRHKNFVEFTKFSFQSEKFDIPQDKFYEQKPSKFNGFSFQIKDFDYETNKKIIYG